MASRAIHVLQVIWLPLLAALLWQWGAATGKLNKVLFPAPGAVLAEFTSMSRSGELFLVLMATLGRYGIGSAIGIVAGILCGLAMGFSRMIRGAFEPTIAGLYATPKLTLLPLFLLLLGIGDPAKIALIALVAFIFVATQVNDAVRGMDPFFVEVARNYGAGKRALIRRVYLPAILPQLFTAMRIALTRSLVAALSLELISGPDGIGTLIWTSWQTLQTERLFVGIFLSAGLGIVLHYGLLSLESKVVAWKGGS